MLDKRPSIEQLRKNKMNQWRQNYKNRQEVNQKKEELNLHPQPIKSTAPKRTNTKK
jgi:hypothetical protein